MTGGERRWLEVAVALPAAAPDAADVLAATLVELGGRAVQERDGHLVTHLEEPGDPEAVTAAVREALCGAVPGVDLDVVLRWQDHQDWAEAWKRGLDTRRITDRLVVTPTWLPHQPRGSERVLVLDPGMAFGTAEHGTTRGCLRLLDGLVRPGQRVLDVGAGSGILAIAAVLLDADHCLAVEGDPLAVEALRENVERNGVGDRVEVVERWAEPEWLADRAPRDGLVANIESGVLQALLPAFRAALGAGDGWLILSGILATEWAEVAAAATGAGFTLQDVDADGEWRSASFVVDAD